MEDSASPPDADRDTFGPMGHATHFLQRLERIEGPALDLALDLYREPGLLAAVMARLRLPAGPARFALALEDGPEPPHALVTGDGGFITCLGPGMRPTDTPSVSHARLRIATEDHFNWAHLNAREGRTQVVLRRLCRAGPLLAREDFEDLLVISSMLPMSTIEHITDVAGWLGEFQLGFRPRDYEHLDDEKRGTLLTYRSLLWSLGHASILATEGWLNEGRLGVEVNPEALAQLLFASTHMGQSGLYLRATWCMARLGRQVLPVLKDYVQQWEAAERSAPEGHRHEFLHGFAALLSLPAIAARHAALRAEIEKFLLRYVPADLRSALPTLDREALKQRTAALPIRAQWATYAASVLQERDPTFPTGREVMEAIAYCVLHESGAEGGMGDLPFEPFVRALPGTSPPLLWMDPELKYTFMHMVPAFARLDAVDQFLPRALLDRLALRPDSVSKVDVMRAQLTIIHRVSGRGRPVVKAATPGRNEVCGCGSGKKYKKCCGR